VHFLPLHTLDCRPQSANIFCSDNSRLTRLALKKCNFSEVVASLPGKTQLELQSHWTRKLINHKMSHFLLISLGIKLCAGHRTLLDYVEV